MRISDWSSDVCSSDLVAVQLAVGHDIGVVSDVGASAVALLDVDERAHTGPCLERVVVGHRERHALRGIRSAEHTSELQSLMRHSYAVFCLNKKKKKQPKANT